MRTTLNIADDVLYVVKAAARREKKPIGVVVSELVRKGLSQSDAQPSPRVEGMLAHYGVHPLPKRGGVVTNEMIDALRDDGLG
jgi:hypothetical protein